MFSYKVTIININNTTAAILISCSFATIKTKRPIKIENKWSKFKAERQKGVKNIGTIMPIVISKRSDILVIFIFFMIFIMKSSIVFCRIC